MASNIQKMDLVGIDLNQGTVHRSWYNCAIGMKDNKGDAFGILVYRDKVPVDLTGISVQGYFRNPQGTNIAITTGNTVDGNMAYVVLPQACYDYDGQFTLAIKLIGGGITGTMRIVDGMVNNTNVDGAVAPTGTVPTYQEVLSVFEQMQDALEEYDDKVAEQDAQIDNLKGAFDNLEDDLVPRLIPSGGASGQSLRKRSGTDYDLEWASVGLPTNAQTAAAVSAWLNEHPEATTTVDFRIVSKVFDSVSNMASDLTLAAGENVRTCGYYKSGDGGGAYYKVTTEQPDDIFTTLGNGLFAKLIHAPGIVNGLQVGLKNDNSTDISTVVNSLTGNYAIYLPAGQYKVDSTLFLKNPLIGENWTETSNIVSDNIPKNRTALRSGINGTTADSIIYMTGAFANTTICNMDIYCSGLEYAIRIDHMTVSMNHTFVDKVSIRSLKSCGIYLGTNETVGTVATGRSRLIQIGQVTVMGLYGYDTIGIEYHSPDVYFDHVWLCTKVGIDAYSMATCNYAHIYTGCLEKDTASPHWWDTTKGIILRQSSDLTFSMLYLDTCAINIYVDGISYNFRVSQLYLYGDRTPYWSGEVKYTAYTDFLVFADNAYVDTGMIIVDDEHYVLDKPYEIGMTPADITKPSRHIQVGHINARLAINRAIRPVNGGLFTRYPQTLCNAQSTHVWHIDQAVTSGNVLEIATLRFRGNQWFNTKVSIQSPNYVAEIIIYKQNAAKAVEITRNEIFKTDDGTAYDFCYELDESSAYPILHIFAITHSAHVYMDVSYTQNSNYIAAIAYDYVTYSLYETKFAFFEIPYDSETMVSIADANKLLVRKAYAVAYDLAAGAHSYTQTLNVQVSGYDLIGVVGFMTDDSPVMVSGAFPFGTNSVRYKIYNSSNAQKTGTVNIICLYAKQLTHEIIN